MTLCVVATGITGRNRSRQTNRKSTTVLLEEPAATRTSQLRLKGCEADVQLEQVT